MTISSLFFNPKISHSERINSPADLKPAVVYSKKAEYGKTGRPGQAVDFRHPSHCQSNRPKLVLCHTIKTHGDPPLRGTTESLRASYRPVDLHFCKPMDTQAAIHLPAFVLYRQNATPGFDRMDSVSQSGKGAFIP